MGKFALIPVMPTPNGPLHLGHVAGPYLKMDILTRYLRSTGHTVALVSASDPHETHVLPKALANNVAPEHISCKYHEVIKNCYETLNIEFDAYINPLDKHQDIRLRELNRTLFSDLFRGGKLVFKEEQVPYSELYGWPLVGSLIGGTCPVCGVDDAAGFHCEECGAENSPSELGDTRSEITPDRWQWRTYKSAFLKLNSPNALVDSLDNIVGDQELVGIAKAHIARSGGLVRLSHPGHWGIPFELPSVSVGSVAFSYPGLLTLSALCADACLSLLGTDTNPMLEGSDVNTVMSFGFDNVIPLLVGVHGQAVESSIFRPFTKYLTNRFWTLDDQKFSTSRSHALWANDAPSVLQSSPDVIRLYMAQLSGETRKVDFSTKDFQRFHSRLKTLMNTNLETHLKADESSTAKAGATLAPNTTATIALVERTLSLSSLDISSAASAVENWLINYTESKELNTQTWLLISSVLGWPFMPTFFQALWNALGPSGRPYHDKLRAILASRSSEEINKASIQTLISQL